MKRVTKKLEIYYQHMIENEFKNDDVNKKYNILFLIMD